MIPSKDRITQDAVYTFMRPLKNVQLPSLICLPICTVGEIDVRITYTDNYLFSLNNQSAPGHHVHKAYIWVRALDLSPKLRVDHPNFILVNISFMAYCHF